MMARAVAPTGKPTAAPALPPPSPDTQHGTDAVTLAPKRRARPPAGVSLRPSKARSQTAGRRVRPPTVTAEIRAGFRTPRWPRRPTAGVDCQPSPTPTGGGTTPTRHAGTTTPATETKRTSPLGASPGAAAPNQTPTHCGARLCGGTPRRPPATTANPAPSNLRRRRGHARHPPTRHPYLPGTMAPGH